MKKIPAYTIEGYISEPDWGILGNQKRFRAKGIISFYTKAQYLTTLSVCILFLCYLTYRVFMFMIF